MDNIKIIDTEELATVSSAISPKGTEIEDVLTDYSTLIENIINNGFAADDTSNTQASIQMIDYQVKRIYQMLGSMDMMINNMFYTIEDQVLAREDEIASTISEG